MNPIDPFDPVLSDDPRWYRDAVIYELHVRSFCDSDGDGVGDFKGLTSRLGYLEELGVTALWILPFYPSPLRDDGYDIADYRSVNPAYGTLEDFQEFLAEAHRRGMRVITELVINHTSDQHPWFQRARRAPPGSPEREFYVWSDDPGKYSETRIIFQDFEPSNWTWDPVAEAYYWHRFYHHQPDLNFESPGVRRELFEAMDFWLEMGVDGMRLDAIPYLYEREGTNCENLPETHAFLKELRAHVDEHFENRMLLAEANQWPEDAAAYFGDGDECHMNFHFPLMPRLFMAVQMEDGFPMRDILDQTPGIPEGCQWALFLRNHDELTLEMVTDEERDYMYRVYAENSRARINLGIRRRLAPLLGNDRRKIELLNSLLLSMPGTPVLYYGDEIGMGDNFFLGDRHGVRTPMQWDGGRNAGFSDANPQSLFLPVIIDPEYHYQAVNAEIQHENPASLLWWMRRIIQLRKHHPAFGRGTLEWVEHDNPRVVAFLREHEGETLLVVANLSRFAQSTALRLSVFQGIAPMELFGHHSFPRIGAEAYPLTLAPYGFLWFSLSTDAEEAVAQSAEAAGKKVPRVLARDGWAEGLEGRGRNRVEPYLLEYLRRQRWFSGKGRGVRAGAVEEVIALGNGNGGPRIVLFRVDYLSGEAERYLLTLTASGGPEGEGVQAEHSEAIVWEAVQGEITLQVHDAALTPAFSLRLLEVIAGGERIGGERCLLAGLGEGQDLRLRPAPAGGPGIRPVGVEQSNTSVSLGDRWILKLLRRVEPGLNPEREMGGFLREVDFPYTPELVGALELRQAGEDAAVVGLVHTYVPNQGDAWSHALDVLGQFFEEALAIAPRAEEVALPGALMDRARARLAGEEMPDEVRALMGRYLPTAALLGERTAELHVALASGPPRERFDPEPFSTLYQRSLYQSIRNLVGTTFELLERKVDDLPPVSVEPARDLLDRRDVLLQRFTTLLGGRLDGRRIRVHGDLHLGQFLHTGRDFHLIDFGGEPGRSPGERSLKRSPLKDVGGMVRSFDYAARAGLRDLEGRGGLPAASVAHGLALARFWSEWAGVEYLAGYLGVEGIEDLLPPSPGAQRSLLEYFVLDKALYELRYELNHRPAWVDIPLAGVRALATRPEEES
ncbi:MAG: maltose alpha-D-glucosyltransferase [Gemmatimonadota bacterium]